LRRLESHLAHRVDYSDAGCRQRGVSTAAAFNSRVTDNILRVGVNYKFDPNEIWSIY